MSDSLISSTNMEIVLYALSSKLDLLASKVASLHTASIHCHRHPHPHLPHKSTIDHMKIEVPRFDGNDSLGGSLKSLDSLIFAKHPIKNHSPFLPSTYMVMFLVGSNWWCVTVWSYLGRISWWRLRPDSHVAIHTELYSLSLRRDQWINTSLISNDWKITL